jgi:hypothetical protein
MWMISQIKTVVIVRGAVCVFEIPSIAGFEAFNGFVTVAVEAVGAGIGFAVAVCPFAV